MAEPVSIDFAALDKFEPAAGAAKGKGPLTVVAFCGDALGLGTAAGAALDKCIAQVRKAASAARFRGKKGAVLELLAPHGMGADRLLVIGTGVKAQGPLLTEAEVLSLGGIAMGRLGASGMAAVLFDAPGFSADDIGAFAQGAQMRNYKFDTYKTRKEDDEDSPGAVGLTLYVRDVAAARRVSKAGMAVTEGVALARTLVNEPPNVLFPDEFARRCKELEKLGVTVEVMDRAALEKAGFRALLGVAQGSAHEARVVIMRWRGAKKAQPIAFVGKGVTFDTGGISIKPSGGMEDMKGDMGGAACVTGLMHALAARKAKADVIGAIGIVENMPDGAAQRPGDIVRSLSGQTIEIINTDAEGRLVLADLLWHVQATYKPAFMIDLATLTGAILVALAQEHAGLFSNNDELSERIAEAGKSTGEAVWRMPLGPAYDKMIDSKFADMKNTGGRHGGSITAAQFLQRFVNKVPWAHLDIAGTAMGSLQSDINQSWGSGWGVRLLDRLVSDHYEG